MNGSALHSPTQLSPMYAPGRPSPPATVCYRTRECSYCIVHRYSLRRRILLNFYLLHNLALARAQ